MGGTPMRGKSGWLAVWVSDCLLVCVSMSVGRLVGRSMRVHLKGREVSS
jgi:hypothetical protein